MNHRGTILATVAILLIGTAQAGNGIEGSAHDLTAYWATDQPCQACHAPHNARVDVPLWNHTMSTATYTLYGSSSMNAVSGKPGPNSKLCLSCHDGTVGISDFGGSLWGPGGYQFSPGDRGYIGTDLGNDHPIGISYDTALATGDGNLADPAVRTVTVGESPTKSGTVANLMLAAGKVECTTCHDVHNIYSVGTRGLVKVTMTGSSLCLQCHTK